MQFLKSSCIFLWRIFSNVITWFSLLIFLASEFPDFINRQLGYEIIPIWSNFWLRLVGGACIAWAVMKPFHEMRKKLVLYGLEDAPIFEWDTNIVEHEPGKNYWSKIMIRIKQTSGATSKNCIVKIDRLMTLPNNQPCKGFDTLALKWDGRLAREKEIAIDIRNDETVRVGLLASPQDDKATPGFHIVWASDAYANAKLNYKPGNYLVCVKLYGDNIRPAQEQCFIVYVGSTPNSIRINKTPIEGLQIDQT